MIQSFFGAAMMADILPFDYEPNHPLLAEIS
jgi:hypothetical protein